MLNRSWRRPSWRRLVIDTLCVGTGIVLSRAASELYIRLNYPTGHYDYAGHILSTTALMTGYLIGSSIGYLLRGGSSKKISRRATNMVNGEKHASDLLALFTIQFGLQFTERKFGEELTWVGATLIHFTGAVIGFVIALALVTLIDRYFRSRTEIEEPGYL